MTHLFHLFRQGGVHCSGKREGEHLLMFSPYFQTVSLDQPGSILFPSLNKKLNCSCHTLLLQILSVFQFWENCVSDYLVKSSPDQKLCKCQTFNWKLKTKTEVAKKSQDNHKKLVKTFIKTSLFKLILLN